MLCLIDMLLLSKTSSFVSDCLLSTMGVLLTDLPRPVMSFWFEVKGVRSSRMVRLLGEGVDKFTVGLVTFRISLGIVWIF